MFVDIWDGIAQLRFFFIINKILIYFTGGTWYWLGGTDFGREGTWYWDHTKKPIVYEDWHHGEPNGNRNENCLVKSGLEVDAWFSVDCLIAEVAYLCEKDNAL